MSYFHVFITRKDGKDIFSSGEILPIASISRVKVIKTDDPKDIELEKLRKESRNKTDEFNRNSSVVLISLGRGYHDEDIIHCGNDVTSEFIDTAPGEGTRLQRFIKALHNPWVVRIGGGVLLIVGGWLLSKWLR
jgi:hypothetical protein